MTCEVALVVWVVVVVVVSSALLVDQTHNIMKVAQSEVNEELQPEDQVIPVSCGCRLPDACPQLTPHKILHFDTGCPSEMIYCCATQDNERTLPVMKPDQDNDTTASSSLVNDKNNTEDLLDTINMTNQETEASIEFIGEKDYSNSYDNAYQAQVQLNNGKVLSSPEKINETKSGARDHKRFSQSVSLDLGKSSDQIVENYQGNVLLTDSTLETVVKDLLGESSTQSFLTAEPESLTSTTASSAAETVTVKLYKPVDVPSKLPYIIEKPCYNISANTTTCFPYSDLNVTFGIPMGYNYQTVDLLADGDQMQSQMEDSFKFFNFTSKGVSFFFFYFSYVIALIYAGCYFISFIVPENTVLSIVLKVGLASYAPIIIRLPFFEIGNLFLSWIIDSLF